MALRQVRIGSLPDVFQYDDGDFGSALETDHYIKTTQAPAANEDVVRLQDLDNGAALDGDHVDISWDPIHYTPDDSPAEAADVNDLAAHLKGVDNFIGGLLATIVTHNNEVICHDDEVVVS